MAKALVTGGAGFIGSHITDALLAVGHEVHVLDNLSSGFANNVPTGATLHTLDINDAAAADLIRTRNFDYILHQAAQINVRASVDDPRNDAQQNILGTLNLLEAARLGGVQKFLFASSGGAGYGEQVQFPAPETHPIQPLSPYGIAKMSVELYLYYYQQVYGLHTIALRYGNVYGPRQNPHGEAGVIAVFAQRMLGGQQPIINGDGLQTRDYVFVKDVVAANLAALGYNGSGAFNVGTSVETDVVTLFDHINAAGGGHFKRTHSPAKAGEQRRSVLDITKAKTELKWQPQHTLQAGLAETLAWFRQQQSQSNPA
jgi:UDP-glucose 4-epimerase